MLRDGFSGNFRLVCPPRAGVVRVLLRRSEVLDSRVGRSFSIVLIGRGPAPWVEVRLYVRALQVEQEGRLCLS